MLLLVVMKMMMDECESLPGAVLNAVIATLRSGDVLPRRNAQLAAVLLTFAVVSGAVSVHSDSLALAVVATHAAFTALSCATRVLAQSLARCVAPERFTYGLARLPLLCDFSASVARIFVAVFLIVHAVERVLTQQPVHSCFALHAVTLLAVPLHLLAVSRSSASAAKPSALLGGGARSPESISWTLEACGAALRSTCVWAGAWASSARGWNATDGVLTLGAGLAVAAFAVPGAVRHARTLLQGTDAAAASERALALRDIQAIPGVLDIIDEHFWAVGPSAGVVATLQVRARDDADVEALRTRIVERLRSSGVAHPTVQVDQGTTVAGAVPLLYI